MQDFLGTVGALIGIGVFLDTVTRDARHGRFAVRSGTYADSLLVFYAFLERLYGPKWLSARAFLLSGAYVIAFVGVAHVVAGRFDELLAMPHIFFTFSVVGGIFAFHLSFLQTRIFINESMFCDLSASRFVFLVSDFLISTKIFTIVFAVFLAAATFLWQFYKQLEQVDGVTVQAQLIRITSTDMYNSLGHDERQYIPDEEYITGVSLKANSLGTEDFLGFTADVPDVKAADILRFAYQSDLIDLSLQETGSVNSIRKLRNKHGLPSAAELGVEESVLERLIFDTELPIYFENLKLTIPHGRWGESFPAMVSQTISRLDNLEDAVLSGRFPVDQDFHFKSYYWDRDFGWDFNNSSLMVCADGVSLDQDGSTSLPDGCSPARIDGSIKRAGTLSYLGVSGDLDDGVWVFPVWLACIIPSFIFYAFVTSHFFFSFLWSFQGENWVVKSLSENAPFTTSLGAVSSIVWAGVYIFGG